MNSAETSSSSASQQSQAPNSPQPQGNSVSNSVDALMARQPSMARGDWKQTSWFDHLAANRVLQSIHGDPSSAPQFAEMMRDVRQLPASMASGSSPSDDGLFKRILTGADEIGQRTSDPQQAYGQFRGLVDGELKRSDESSQVRVPWHQESSSGNNTPPSPTTGPASPPIAKQTPGKPATSKPQVRTKNAKN